MKILRRLIIVFSLIALAPSLFNIIQELFDKEIPEHIMDQVEAEQAEMIEIDKEIKLDQDIIKFRHLILSDKETLLIFETHTKEPGWTFPNSALQLGDNNGNTYRYNGGSSGGNSWGQLIINRYEPLPQNVKSLTVTFDWYDRSFQTNLSLGQGEQ